MVMRRRLAVLGVAASLDLLLGELPDRAHPVAWLGRAASWLDQRLASSHKGQGLTGGVALVAVLAAPAMLVAGGFSRVTRSLPGITGIIVEALLLKPAFAARALFEHASRVEAALENGDLPAARQAVGLSVSRDTSDLPPGAVASAAIESLSENASDSIVAPWCWYLAGGLPTAWAYRVVNTLDAMVGYRERGLFGAPAARLDDVLNYLPARLTGALLALAADRPRATLDGALRDHYATPSPNAGWPMAAAAHALGVRLEKRGHHVLNPDGRTPGAIDIARATSLVQQGIAAGALAAAVLAFALSRNRGEVGT